jgi:hypothetical protein
MSITRLVVGFPLIRLMKSPAQQSVIQIDITNACFYACSNCTRFIGHHKYVTHMDFNTFQKAVESLFDYPNMVGIIGGEPTLHPQFDKFVRYYADVIPARQNMDRYVLEPISNLCDYRNRIWNTLYSRRGLWTSLGPGYLRHFELIRDVFEYQCINDHQNEGKHQALMISRKELGIEDQEFYLLRDSCWIQDRWSATITQKGAFFCEVAASLDMLMDGPGRWPIEKKWWERRPTDFKDQLEWCELCGGCLAVPYTSSKSEVDLVSPGWQKKLESLGSHKKCMAFDVANYKKTEYTRNSDNFESYLVDHTDITRVAKDTAACLTVSEINAVLVCVGYSHLLERTLKYNVNRVHKMTVVTEETDLETRQVAEKLGADVCFSHKKNHNKAVFNKGAMLNDGIRHIISKTLNPWVLVTDADIILSPALKDVSKLILNPGGLYYAERLDIKLEDIELYADTVEEIKNFSTNIVVNRDAWGYFQFFNINAAALTKKDEWYSEEFYSAGFVDKNFRDKWGAKKYLLSRCLHLKHGSWGANWNGPQ